MTGFNQIERSRRSRGCLQRTFLCSRPEQKGFSPPGAIYIRISTSQQQTDRQETELKEFALRKDLEWFQEHDCPAYFHKQNLWVKDQSDIGTQIMIQVLALMSQYEIELFTSRGIDGKISV